MGKLHKKPHVATPDTGTPCRVHVLQSIIKTFYSAERCHKENTQNNYTMGKAK